MHLSLGLLSVSTQDWEIIGYFGVLLIFHVFILEREVLVWFIFGLTNNLTIINMQFNPEISITTSCYRAIRFIILVFLLFCWSLKFPNQLPMPQPTLVELLVA